jgi:hypothetical protein
VHTIKFFCNSDSDKRAREETTVSAAVSAPRGLLGRTRLGSGCASLLGHGGVLMLPVVVTIGSLAFHIAIAVYMPCEGCSPTCGGR